MGAGVIAQLRGGGLTLRTAHSGNMCSVRNMMLAMPPAAGTTTCAALGLERCGWVT